MAGPTRSRTTDGVVLDGRYRLDGLIARGGMSVVHRGMDLRLDRPVAIKILDGALAEDPVFVRRFEREARAAARLAHPGVVAVHDQGRDADGTTFLVLELVEGGTLRDVLREHGRLRPAEALTVIEQVVVALSVAHERGLVHRDVKPENVLVSAAGAVKVADFGLVGAAWDRGGATGDQGDEPAGPDELILGTVAYLSPEQVADGRADARSDLYAAGIVLFELLTGVPPHGGDTAAEVAAAHVHADVPPPSRLVSGVPRALDALVVSLTRRDPEDRPSDATAFLAEARRVRAATALPFQPVPPPPMRQAVPPPPRPMGGTRAFEPDDLPDLDDDSDGDPDGDDPGVVADDDDDPDDDEDAHPRRRGAARPAVDDVDDRIERLARRRARIRSRRVLAAWVIGVGAATVVAGLAGWDLGSPAP